MSRPPKWTPDQLEAAIAAYVAGKPRAEILPLGVPWGTLHGHLARRGIPKRQDGRPAGWAQPQLDKRSGYVRMYAPDHPYRGDRGPNTLKHVRVMELHIGRRIRHPEEIVHHKDHNRQNNDLSNLELMTRSEHARMHRREASDHRLAENG